MLRKVALVSLGIIVSARITFSQSITGRVLDENRAGKSWIIENEDDVDLFYNQETNTIYIDRYGNNTSPGFIQFGGEMGEKRVGDMFSLDYEKAIKHSASE